MPQEFEQARSEETSKQVDETIAVENTEVPDAADVLDAVLDDIESVLESNAEEYVGSFVQKGGE
jgi:prokaryotic ubiquitin-like protein Pup